MKISSVKVVYGQTINMGNYNSIRPGVELQAEIEEGDDLKDVFTSLKEQAQQLTLIQAVDMANEVDTIDRVGVRSYVESFFSGQLES